MRILDKIKEVLEEINSCKDVELDSDLKLDLGLDSLSLVSLIVGLEEEFEITFDDSDLDPSQLIRVEDLVDLVEKSL